MQIVPEKTPEKAFESRLRLEVASLGVEAKLTVREATFGVENQVFLDGSLSRDKDNKDSELKVCFHS